MQNEVGVGVVGQLVQNLETGDTKRLVKNRVLHLTSVDSNNLQRSFQWPLNKKTQERWGATTLLCDFQNTSYYTRKTAL